MPAARLGHMVARMVYFTIVNTGGTADMSLSNFERYLIGYMIGFTVFFLAVPYFLYLLASLFYFQIIDHWSRLIIAGPLFMIGIYFAIWSNMELVKMGKGGPTDIFNVAVSPRTERLVVTGPYELTRNPMVFGAFCCYFALALYLNSMVDLIVLAGFFVGVRFYLQETEERRLWKDFGKEYEEYRERVWMIVPRVWGRKKDRSS
jgi:protein-S-isoprenylcysteine O-methyltransferase Ste14